MAKRFEFKQCRGCNNLVYVSIDASWLCEITGREFGSLAEASSPTLCTKWEELKPEPTIWAMCPYCEEEVEVYEAEDVNCPNCGATFSPSEEEIELSKQAWEDEL